MCSSDLRRIARRAALREADSRADDVGTDLQTEAAEARDETEEVPAGAQGTPQAHTPKAHPTQAHTPEDTGGDPSAGGDR